MTRVTTRVLAAGALWLTLAACDHPTPFGTAVAGADTTFSRGSPRQLTFNLGKDQTPAWTGDGSAILYSAEETATGGRDHCLVRMPGTGGTIQSTLCGDLLGGLDSTDVWAWPAPAADGRLLLTQTWSLSGQISPVGGALELATVARPDVAITLRSSPYRAPDGQTHQGLSFPGWLGNSEVVYIGDRIDYPRPCPSCRPDTLVTGIGLVRLDLNNPGQLSVIPGTGDITSVAPFGATTVLMTTRGSSLVTQLSLNGGTSILIHDFAPDGIVRDVHAAGGRLVAVVGGKVSSLVDSILGPLQPDTGGALHVVDLLTGNDQVLSAPGLLFRHPALRPDGRAVVAEGYRYSLDSIFGLGGLVAVDTNVSPNSDLWLFDLP